MPPVTLVRAAYVRDHRRADRTEQRAPFAFRRPRVRVVRALHVRAAIVLRYEERSGMMHPTPRSPAFRGILTLAHADCLNARCAALKRARFAGCDTRGYSRRRGGQAVPREARHLECARGTDGPDRHCRSFSMSVVIGGFACGRSRLLRASQKKLETHPRWVSNGSGEGGIRTPE